MKNEYPPRNQIANPLSLVSPEIIEQLPSILPLKNQFSELLPLHFGKPRVYMSPVPNCLSVIRAECGNKGCGTRAYVHIVQNNPGEWTIVEKDPQFDRVGNANCAECKEMFSV